MLSEDFSTGTVSLVVAIAGDCDVCDDGLEAEIRRILEKLHGDYENTAILLLSNLAEGASRIAVQAAMKSPKFPWFAILPVPFDDYRADFTSEESDRIFQTQYAAADGRIELPPMDGKSRAEHDTRLDDYLIQYSQILIAVQDVASSKPTDRVAQVIDRKLRSSPRAMRLELPRINAEGAGPVYRIYTKPSDKRGRIPTIPVDKKPEVPDGTTFDNYRASYELLNRFNADVARARWNFKNAVVKSRKDLFVETEPDGLSEAENWVIDVYSRADALAGRYAWRGLLIWKAVFALLALAGVCLALLHATDGSGAFLCGYYACLLPAFGLMIYEWKSKDRVRHEDYRALAEALRVQVYWMAGGLPDLVADRYLRKQAGETMWIRDAISECALYPGVLSLSPPEPEGRAARLRLTLKWVESQKDFFANRVGKHAGKKKALHAFASVTAVVGFALPLAGFLRGEPGPFLAGAALAMWWAALAWDYAERRGFTQEAQQYERMGKLFQDADEDLTELAREGNYQRCDKTLRELGSEALAESADWLAMHRERKLSASLGAK